MATTKREDGFSASTTTTTDLIGLDKKLLCCFRKCYPNAKNIFIPFDTYCAHNQQINAFDAAKQRVAEVWHMWQLANGPGASGTLPAGTAQLVGYYIDLHFPILIQQPPKTHLCEIYQHKLAPEQSVDFPTVYKFPFAPAFTHDLEMLVGNLWNMPPLKMSTGWMAILKLLKKGLPEPKSVRYIQPQANRCLHTTQSRAMLAFIGQLYRLGGYRHSTRLAAPHERIAVYKQTPTDQIATIVSKVALGVYKMLAECISAVLVCNVTLLIQAERRLPNLAKYIATYGSTAQQSSINPTQRNHYPTIAYATNMLMQTPFEKVNAVAIPSPPKFQQIPLDPMVSKIQLKNINLRTGLDGKSAYWCGLCAVLHVRPLLMRLPRTSKRTMGVSVDLADPALAPTCNLCGLSSFLELVQLAGHLTIAYVASSQKQPVKLVVCGECTMVSIDAQYIGLIPFCASCYKQRLLASINAIKCACGRSVMMGSQTTFTALNSAGDACMYAPCHFHVGQLPVRTTVPLTPIADYLDVLDFKGKCHASM